MRRFTCTEGTSNKYWYIELTGKSFKVTFGRAGSKGQSKTKVFDDAATAKAEHDKLIRQKLAKGYVEDAPAAPAARGLRETLEEALAAHPDDLAAHMAYADYLQEQGDPRGEFIQVQLTLEDETKTPAQRKQLQKRERELLDVHEREWLGELAPFLLGTPEELHNLFAAEVLPDYADQIDDVAEEMQFRHAWARGWLDRFECGTISLEMVRKLGRAPIARLLRVLIFRNDFGAGIFRYARGPDIPDNQWARLHPCQVLACHPAIHNVRVFHFGQTANRGSHLHDAETQYQRLAPLFERMPRLEQLSILGCTYK